VATWQQNDCGIGLFVFTRRLEEPRNDEEW